MSKSVVVTSPSSSRFVGAVASPPSLSKVANFFSSFFTFASPSPSLSLSLSRLSLICFASTSVLAPPPSPSPFVSATFLFRRLLLSPFTNLLLCCLLLPFWFSFFLFF
ncbi:uncharacterized protein DS421_11g328350 [Arachis hypogaea]|nr:uncharacterized protein DS421_11g328350 [Arachis hypogaea]